MKKGNWEEVFDKEFEYMDGQGIYDTLKKDIKSFTRQLLEEQKKEILNIIYNDEGGIPPREMVEEELNKIL